MAKLIACAGQGVELSGVPTEIKILPLGRVHSQKGDFNVDDESFELIRKQFKDRKLDLVIDYEHQTLSDVQAPAGGSLTNLKKGIDVDGNWVNIVVGEADWVEEGDSILKAKVAVQFDITFEGGIYQDRDIKPMDIGSVG